MIEDVAVSVACCLVIVDVATSQASFALVASLPTTIMCNEPGGIKASVMCVLWMITFALCPFKYQLITSFHANQRRAPEHQLFKGAVHSKLKFTTHPNGSRGSGDIL